MSRDEELVEGMIAGVMANVGPLLDKLVERVNKKGDITDKRLNSLRDRVDLLERQMAAMQEKHEHDMNILLRDALIRPNPVNAPWGKINTDQVLIGEKS